MRRIRPFVGTELVKVLTGIRRCGKSVMMGLIQEELLSSGVDGSQIISINFENMSNAPFCTAAALHDEIIRRTAGIKGKVYLSIYFCLQLPERTNHRFFPADGRSGHSENVDKVSIRYGVSVQFSEKRVRQWTRLALWPLFSPTFCGSKPLISSRLLRQAEASIPSFCLSTNGCRCCSNTRSCLKV